MPTLMPLLARGRYDDSEWMLATGGQCSWTTSSYPGFGYCGQPSDPTSHYRYCTGHDEQVRDTPGYGR